MQTKKYQANNEADWEEMCRGVEYELLVRTIDRLSSDVATELAISAQEFLEAQPAEQREALRQPVNEIAAEVARQIIEQLSDNQKENNHE